MPSAERLPGAIVLGERSGVEELETVVAVDEQVDELVVEESESESELESENKVEVDVFTV